MRALAQAGLLVMAGLAVARLAGLDSTELSNSPSVQAAIYMLLAISLYSATSSVDLRKVDVAGRRLLLRGVLGGITAKAVLVSAVAAVAFWDPVMAVVSIAVVPIFPLAMRSDGLEENLSPRVRDVYKLWWSFDDPVTNLIMAGVLVFAIPRLRADSAVELVQSPLLGFAIELAAALLLAVIAYLLGRLTRTAGQQEWLNAALLTVCLALSVSLHAIFAMALIGLFVRPQRLMRAVSVVADLAAYVAAFLIGLLLIDGAAMFQGIALALIAFCSHFIVAWVVAVRYPATDRLFLAISQQCGLSAVAVGMTLELYFPGRAVAVIGTALIAIAFMHYLANHLAERYMRPLSRQ